MKINSSFVLCPICKSKTRTKIYDSTQLLYFPLFCPKCKRETTINIKKNRIQIIKEPDAKSRRADISK